VIVILPTGGPDKEHVGGRTTHMASMYATDVYNA